MSTHRDSSAEAEEIRRQAAEWLARVDRGLSATEQDELSDWLAGNPARRAAYVRLRRHWRQLDQLVEWRPEHGTEPNPDLLAPAQRRRFAGWMVTLAAAAAVTLGIGYVVWRPPVDTARSPRPVVLTESAQPRRVLADGSVIELNRGAVVSVEYSPATRRVRLEKGEAHFTVQKNHARPFIVTAQGIDVRAVGTAFNVRLDSSVVEVLVTEGQVRVDSGSPTDTAQPRKPLVPQLAARQRALVSVGAATPPQIATLTDEEIERVLAWQHRLLEFTGTPLGEVVAEFNKRNALQIVVVDPDLSAEPFTASIRSENVEGFLRVIQGGFAGVTVRVERKGDTEVYLYRTH